MVERRRNGDLGNLLGPLTIPVYVIQMARSKRWSRDARLKWAYNLRNAAADTVEACDAFIEREWDTND